MMYTVYCTQLVLIISVASCWQALQQSLQNGDLSIQHHRYPSQLVSECPHQGWKMASKKT